MSTTTEEILPHTCHLAKHKAYPERAPVKHVSWAVPYPEYVPVPFTHPSVLANGVDVKPDGWADPEVYSRRVLADVAQRLSFAGTWKNDKFLRLVNLDKEGSLCLPRNPMGRTGISGRGLLGKYGPNHAADSILARLDPQTNKLQCVVITRKDNGMTALPGGMIEPGEKASKAAKREFGEEAQNLEQGEEVSKDGYDWRKELEELMENRAREIYCGYVDDPRNTDNAWMETSVYAFVITSKKLAEAIQLRGGDDASNARWMDIEDNDGEVNAMYAGHGEFIQNALPYIRMITAHCG